DISDLLAQYGGGDGAAEEAEPADEKEDTTETKAASAPAPSGDGAATSQPAPVSGSQEDGRIKASPLARKLAGDQGVDLASIQGSGPHGRIIKRDVEAAVGQPQTKPTAPSEAKPDREPAKTPRPVPVPAAEGADEYEAVRISQMRKAITRRLGQSKFTAPHFYLTVDIDMEQAIAARQQLNEMAAVQERPKVSFNDLVIKACAVALHQHPMVNASYMEEEGEIRKYNQVHVGVAVAVDEGLVTPVVRNADLKGLARIGEEVREMAGRARERKLQPEEMAGSTLTTSNLGMFGIEEFTAIINPPNACILAIGAIREVPVVKDGEVVPGKRMKVTLSCDHRVVDGATGAQFLQTVKQYLEEPLSLLL
ncbi:MAG TPA: dihydrolipoamide acetyltransferase family protein, partial [Rhodothermales bacterium]|nr:dihydrolipoamide acetyltransferase family protein [Rhodothermales bacterium]